MKKLISILAALALVGSLAAQKRKAPAKPAAKPVHEAVKAPAAPAIAVAPVAPAEHKAHKGIGLFIEGRGTFTLGAGTSNSQFSGDFASGSFTQNGTTYGFGTYQLPNTNGWGGGATIGYQVLQGLGLVVGYDYRSIQSRQWSQSNGFGAGSSATIQNTTNTSILEIGLRPTFHTAHGAFYAGMGFAYVLPFNSTTTINVSNASGVYTGMTGQQIVANLNAGLGAYAELGYNHNLGEHFYIGIGLRALVATANNDGKSTATTTTGGAGAGTTTVNYAASQNPVNATNLPFSSTGITDMGINVNVGLRF